MSTVNFLLLVSSVSLLGAALFDGITTVRFLKNPSYPETGTPWLFGKRPNALLVFGLGGIVITAEIGTALLLNNFSVYAGYAATAGFAYQVYRHVRAGFHNLTLPI